ncbi:Uu.00g060230.m01.CDS01 [Anthostomella pinea]|uniref:Uu.00g060230.m01.CDS01 n=1 Tax=Anthostomella pinea TaxID=933095 RepID=A0AAI8VT17_9PEZI|nr:Uu.00g060230.m01.CDS01 [Anthostomella pinea]
MRQFALRWLALMIPLAIFFLFLSRNTSAYTTVNKIVVPGTLIAAATRISNEAGEDRHAPHVDDAKTIDIGPFWRKWSQIMYDARPDPTTTVQLRGTASIFEPSDPNASRKPYYDLVSNERESLVSAIGRPHTRFVKELLENIAGDESIFQGRGIVMVGGGEYFGPAIVSIHMLRRAGCTLSVEVFVPDDDEYEVEVCESYLPKLNARCVVLAHILAQSSVDGAKLAIRHYQLKAPALLFSSFEEVLLLDSDSIPVADPTTDIFETEPYISSGLIVWPDFWGATESPKFWSVVGVPGFPANLPATSSEAGQLVVNKRTHLAPLLLATYYNVFGHLYYPLLSQGALGQGDKETFMAAAVVLNATYYRVKTPVGNIGRDDGRSYRGTAMVQHLPSDDLAKSQGKPGTVRPAFLHSNTPKMNAGHLVDEGDLVSADGKSRLRLLGSKSDQQKLFGFDLESSVWDLLVQTGCELAGVIRDWNSRKRLCDRLEEHHQKVFHDERQSPGGIYR